MMKQQSFSILLILLMGMVSTRAMAYDLAVENADGVTIYYNYTNDGEELEVTYGDYNSYAGNVVIPEEVTYMDKTRKVTSIGSVAFASCSGLTSVTIPNSVTSIGEYAFYYCSALTSVDIPNSVTSIPSYAFYHCIYLNSITIPNSVTSIGTYAFWNCIALTSVNIPNSVTIIGSCAFYGCSGLTSVIIGNSVTIIGGYAFCQCTGLTSVTIPNSVTIIGSCAFDSCYGLTSITIPNSVTSIGGMAFRGCSGLTSVNIPNSVTIIGSCAFDSCYGLTSITIPNSVTSIGGMAFRGCSGLTSVNIPNSVTSIEYGTFQACYFIQTITLGSGITNIGSHAFSSCIHIKDFYFYADKVPSTDLYAFVDSPIEYATLHVPAASVDEYKDAEPWKDFGTIQGIVEGKVKLSKTKAVIEKGKTLTLKAKVYPTTEDQSVTWKSSDKKVATVTKAGKVKGVGAGTATITCISKATGAKATCKVTVGYVKLNYNELTIEKGEIVKLKSKVYPSTVKDQSVTWESSNPKVVKVASSGKIKGLKAGTAIITCTSNATGLKATCEVTVTKASAAPSMDGTDEDVTGIEEKPVLAEEFDVYDLNGRKVLNKVTSLEGLSDGVYIVNGKKVVIK